MTTYNALTPELLKRYTSVTLPDLAPGMWHRKHRGGKFYRMNHQGMEDALKGHITGRHWVACRARDASIEWLSFDIDARSPEDDPRERYDLLLRIMGPQHPPLVYRTPSGGLRVRYRIPATPMRDLIESGKRGLVSDVLRGGGLHPRSGYIELFPQRTQPDRLPLGASMPLLDPDTLEVVPGCELRDSFSLSAFLRCLERLEAWYAAPLAGLVDHLVTAPRCEPIHVVSADEFTPEFEAYFARAGDGTVSLTGSMADLVNGGLARPSSRFAAEFRVGMAMAFRSEEFRPFGLDRMFTQRQHAFAIARWVAKRHNGYSAEWNAAVARNRSSEAAIEVFAARYLEPTADTGLNMIDRIMRAVQAVDPQAQRIRQLTREEWATIFTMAERHFGPGSDRLKFEVWTAAFLRALKEIIRYHESVVPERNEPRRFDTLEDNSGDHWVLAEIAASWQEKWPYGSGGHGGRTPYLRYRTALESENIVQKVAAHRWPSQRDRHGRKDTPGEASLFKVRRPADATLRDVDVAPWVLKHACAGITIANRCCTLDHAYHTLAATSREEDLRKRYGYSAARALRERSLVLNASVAALLADPVQLFRRVA